MENVAIWFWTILLLVVVIIGICSIFVKPESCPEDKRNVLQVAKLYHTGNGLCFGCLLSGELVKVSGYPAPLSIENIMEIASGLHCSEREIEFDGVDCVNNGYFEAEIFCIGTDKALLICHDPNGNEPDFYALADSGKVEARGDFAIRVEKSSQVKIRELIIDESVHLREAVRNE